MRGMISSFTFRRTCARIFALFPFTLTLPFVLTYTQNTRIHARTHTHIRTQLSILKYILSVFNRHLLLLFYISRFISTNAGCVSRLQKEGEMERLKLWKRNAISPIDEIQFTCDSDKKFLLYWPFTMRVFETVIIENGDVLCKNYPVYEKL